MNQNPNHHMYSHPPPYPGYAMMEEDFFNEKEVHLRDYLRIIKNRRSIVFTAFAIIMILTVVMTYSKTPIFEASAKLLIEENKQNSLVPDGTFSHDPVFLTTQSEIIKSTAVGLKVVDQLNLVENYEEYTRQQPYGFSLSGLLRMIKDWIKKAVHTILDVIGVAEDNQFNAVDDSKEAHKAMAEELAGKVSEDISVRPAADSAIVTLNYLSSNPALAAQIVNSVAKAYIDKTLDMKMETSNYTIKWMTEKADEEKAKLEASEHILQKYIEENDIVTIEDRVTVTPQKLAEINTQLIKTQGRRKEIELLYNQIKQLPDDLKGAESIQVIASDVAIQALRKEILETEKKITDLGKTYGPKHPSMRQAVSDLDILQQQRKAEIQRVIKSVKNEYDLIRDNEREYNNLMNQTKKDTVKLNEKFIQYNILKREVDTNKQLYNTLITKIKEQNMAEEAQSVQVWVIEKAKVPEFPAKPNKKRNIILGIVLSLFCGIGLAFILEYLDNTIKHPDDIEDRFNLPLLGTVIKLGGKKKDKLSKVIPEIESIRNPTSAFAEGFKSIRTSIMLSSADIPPKILLVTSMTPSEGKTTSTINIAVIMAQTGKHVLLIDADMRKPRLHKIFRLENNRGLSSYLAGTSGSGIINKSFQKNLDIVTSGPIPPNPSELLISERTQKLISLAEANYDMIIFDSPPILVVNDGQVISKLVDGIVLVARAGQTPYELFERGQRTLNKLGAKVIGVILNDIDVKKGHHYYYNQYYSSYYQNEKG